MALHFNSENHRRFHIKFLSCLLIQLPGWGGRGKPMLRVIWGGGTVLLIGAVCNGRRGCFCDVFTNGSIVSDTITF